MQFKKPTDEAIKKMTVNSTRALLETLKDKRKAVVSPLDVEIEFYEKVLAAKQEELDKKNQLQLGGASSNA